MKLLALLKPGSLLAALTLLTGCATPALWAKKNYRPAEPPGLALAFRSDTKDVLVSYDERCGKSAQSRRRAYWLVGGRVELDKRGKPRFANPATSAGLKPIPLLGLSQTNAAPSSGYCAFAAPDACVFRLWRDGRELGCFRLPSYEAAPPATFWRIGLTTVTVATDAAIVGIYCMGAAGH